jgi:hypothetical protein
MEQLHCIVYVSSASWLLADAELEEILEKSRRNNAAHGVTGVLLYNDGTIFQYIEGPRDNLGLIFQKIKANPKHKGCVGLLDEPTSARKFPDWFMGFFHPTRSELLNLANEKWWSGTGAADVGASRDPDGLRLLHVFCRSASRF